MTLMTPSELPKFKVPVPSIVLAAVVFSSAPELMLSWLLSVRVIGPVIFSELTVVGALMVVLALAALLTIAELPLTRVT